jgi:TubC N-terminal docking domain
MIASELLNDLTRRGVRLEPRLHIEAPTGTLTSVEREALRLHKLDLLRVLLDDNPTDGSPGPELSRNRWPEQARPPMPLRRCGALVCRTCHVHSPSPHREGCAFPRFEPCDSRWFWLSPHGALKCVACASPADMSLVEAWVRARETGEGDDGWRIPEEILSLLHIATPVQ